MILILFTVNLCDVASVGVYYVTCQNLHKMVQVLDLRFKVSIKLLWTHFTNFVVPDYSQHGSYEERYFFYGKVILCYILHWGIHYITTSISIDIALRK